MHYNFDQIVDRANTNCVKYDLRHNVFGNPDVLPMWVADMDFETPDFAREAVMKGRNIPYTAIISRIGLILAPSKDGCVGIINGRCLRNGCRSSPVWFAASTWPCWHLPAKGMKLSSNRQCILRFTMRSLNMAGSLFIIS